MLISRRRGCAQYIEWTTDEALAAWISDRFAFHIGERGRPGAAKKR